MTFKQKLMIAFSIVLILPMLLMGVALFAVSNYMIRTAGADDQMAYYSSVTGDMENFSDTLDNAYMAISEQYEQDATGLEDAEFLNNLSKKISGSNSYIIVTKDGALFYSGNMAAAQMDFLKLPTAEEHQGNSMKSYYVKNLEKMVKQFNFSFEDGSAGSIYILTKVVMMTSKRFITSMLLLMVVVLVITAALLTQWLGMNFFAPINLLNVAMKKIRDGNLDYRLQTEEEGEIGELYQNYEDMRLRLKESAEEKLEREKQNRELISNISHDLKTPITSIKGYVEGLMDGVANTPEKQERYIRTIYNKANDMNTLINELTLYSRIDNDKVPYNFHRINVADYFGDCVEEIGMDMESRGIELNYSNLVSPDTKIVADPEQMKRVINNIIGNSVKYMDKPDGKIDIRILDEQDSIRVEIEDNGKGIAARDLPNIFDRFYRTDSSRNSAQGGSGIGLSIVKKVIEDHGGYIWATSQEGEGTCLHFVIRKYQKPKEYDGYVVD